MEVDLAPWSELATRVGRGSVNSQSQASYRLRLAEGFLGEARQDVELGRWRSAIDNSQLCVENSAKAVLALIGPIPRSHDPAALLREAIASRAIERNHMMRAEQLLEAAETLGRDVHVQTDYGDEAGNRTPWELFGEAEAREALATAEGALVAARGIVSG